MILRFFLVVLLVLHMVNARNVPQQATGIHVPLVRRQAYRRERVLDRRSGETARIGIGDYLDVTYNVLVQVGGVETPLVLDTGSADLWVTSDACTTDQCKAAGVPLYSQSTFQTANQQVQLLYGDSHTSTQAAGPIGKDTVAIAGLSVPDQYLAAIINTNTTVLETGSAGIIGFGFPAISILWRQLLNAQINGQLPARRDILPDLRSRGVPFPNFDFLRGSSGEYVKRGNTSMNGSDVLTSISTFGPPFTRMISQNVLQAPMFAITLQRDSIDVGGNVGLLSIGELPSGIQMDSLTWVPLRDYPVGQGGLPAPPDAPDEVYPLVWEIALDDVYFDGVLLPRSSLSSPQITLSALVDTGNSLIRGPQDVIAQIFSALGGENFDCSVPHNLTFMIGGKPFPVDPRDFIHQTFTDSVEQCTAALAVTDPPGEGFLYSWSLGDPFLKSALVAYYYGNLTHPSQDPPRIGLLSTMPSDSAERLKQAVTEAADDGGNFPATSNPAPSGTFMPAATGVGGVPQATDIPTDSTDTDGSFANAAYPVAVVSYSLWTVLLLYAPFMASFLLFAL